MRVFHTETLTSLHDGLFHRMVQTEDFDLKTGSDYQWHNVIATCDSMEYTADLKHYWTDSRRWSRLIRQYLNLRDIKEWIEGCREAKNRVAVMQLGKGVKSHKNKGARWRVWGPCMLQLAYREKPEPHLTMISRTSYIGYLSVLDLSVPYTLKKYLPVKDCKFTWHVIAAQMSWMKAFGYLLHEYTDEILHGKGEDNLSPVLQRSRAQMEKLLKLDEEGKHYGQMIYNPFRRLRRRYHTEYLGYDEAQKWEGSRQTKKTNETYHYSAFYPLDSTPVDELDLTPLED